MRSDGLTPYLLDRCSSLQPCRHLGGRIASKLMGGSLNQGGVGTNTRT